MVHIATAYRAAGGGEDVRRCLIRLPGGWRRLLGRLAEAGEEGMGIVEQLLFFPLIRRDAETVFADQMPQNIEHQIELARGEGGLGFVESSLAKESVGFGLYWIVGWLWVV